MEEIEKNEAAMISKRNIVKLIAAAVIVLIGAVYWYYSQYRTGPIEEVEKTVTSQPQ